MRKTAIIYALCVTIILVGGISIFAALQTNETQEPKINNPLFVIKNEAQAIKIGKPVLAERFKDVNWDEEKIIAREKDGVWRVQNDVDYEKASQEGLIIMGGVVYVDLDAKTGKVIKTGIND